MSFANQSLSDSLIQNIIDGKADIDKLMPMFKKEPGRRIKLLRVAETQLRFFRTNPEIASRSSDKIQRIENVIEAIKEECVNKKVVPIKPVKHPQSIIQPEIPEKEPMSLTEEFMAKYEKEIEYIRQNLIDPPSAEILTQRLIKSIKLKGGTKPQDSPIYKIVRYVDTHRDEIEKCSGKMQVYSLIADALNYDPRNLWGILNRYRVNLPERLRPHNREEKTEYSKKESKSDTMVVDLEEKEPEHDYLQPPIEHATPPREYLAPPTKPPVVRKPVITEPVVERQIIEAKDAREIVIKAQGIEIVIKITGTNISIGTEAAIEAPKPAVVPKSVPEPVVAKKRFYDEDFVAYNIRYTARNKACFCYGCGMQIAEPTVAIVQLEEKEKKVVPFHAACTEPGSVVKFKVHRVRFIE